jgi:hypothetical protein
VGAKVLAPNVNTTVNVTATPQEAQKIGDTAAAANKKVLRNTLAGARP